MEITIWIDDSPSDDKLSSRGLYFFRLVASPGKVISWQRAGLPFHLPPLVIDRVSILHDQFGNRHKGKSFFF